MTTSFEKRERAAEGLFVRKEEARFLAHRSAIEALGSWAGESMELDAAAQAAYSQQLVGRLVAGATDDELVMTVQTDLERAGKPSLSGHVQMVLVQAHAAAQQASNAYPVSTAASAEQDVHEAWAQRHPKSGPSWSL